MSKAIGSAADFYRLRVRTVDATEYLDFEWRDDVLYRRSPGKEIEENQYVLVEAVLLGASAVTYPLKTFDSRSNAHVWLTECQDDLRGMTRSEFESAYFPGGSLPKE